MSTTTEASRAAHCVECLRNNFASGQTKPLLWRLSQLKALKKMLSENESLITAALKTDLGRGGFEAVALELLPSVLEIQHCIDNLANWMKPVYTSLPAMMAPATSEIIYEPYGVCLIISAFNYPIQLTLGPLIGAIMGGNCAVIKPSEMAAACEKLLAELIPKYMDNNSFSVICGGIATTSALLDQHWDKIFFTGSTRVGKIVMRAAAENLTPVSLELGGKSPTVVDESVVDLELVAQRICWGKCANAGQTCIAPDYVLVHEKVHDKLVDAIKRCLTRFYGADAEQSPDYCRIISEAHCERLQGLLGDTPGDIVHGGRVKVSSRFVEPTVITNVRLDSKVMQEEIFGPLLPIIKVQNMNDAISFMRTADKAKPLSLYIFAKNRALIDRIISEVPSGGVLVNDTLFHFANPFVPFGGVGPSGLGGYHGKFSFECFSHRRSIMRRDDHILLDIPIRYPPYTATGLSIFKFAASLPQIPPLTLGSVCCSLRHFATLTVVVAVAVGVTEACRPGTLDLLKAFVH